MVDQPLTKLSRADYDAMDDVAFVERVSADIITLDYDTMFLGRYAEIARRGARMECPTVGAPHEASATSRTGE